MPDNREKLSDLADRLRLAREAGYVDLYRDTSCLDGWFCAHHLRAVADAMDKLGDAETNEEYDSLKAELKS